MNRISVKNGMSRWIASVAVLLLALFGIEQALAQVNLTKHNLGGNRAGADSRPASITEVCVFCHTPFGADNSAAAPVWDRTLSAARSYATYNSLGTSSLDGATAPVGSVSIACLSCHDGVQSLNVMINSPQAASDTRWSADNPTLGTASTSQTLRIGVELRRDHPFGSKYGGGAIALGGPPAAPSPYLNTLMKDSDFSSAQSTVLNGQSVWWIDTATGTAGARDKTDIQLYTRVTGQLLSLSDAAGDRPEPFVECASCHDPHSAANSVFLRYPNTASALCLACHAKK